MSKHFVHVRKMQLREGEELWQFVSALQQAVQTNRIVLADGSLDAWLQGIYEDHVIVQDMNTGRLFRADFTRDAKGEFTFAEPVEVRVAFVPIAGEGGGEGGGAEKLAKSDPGQFLDLDRVSKSRWADVLPPRLRTR